MSSLKNSKPLIEELRKFKKLQLAPLSKMTLLCLSYTARLFVMLFVKLLLTLLVKLSFKLLVTLLVKL